MTSANGRRPKGTAALLACVVVGALLAIVLPASASAEPTYFVTVDQVSVSGGPRGSGEVTTRVSPRLPEGATLEGGIRCDDVRVPGPNGTSTIAAANTVDPGYYQVATETCFQDPDSPLRIEGAPGTVRVYGGINTVKRSSTSIQAASAVINEPNRAIVLTAQVFGNEIGDAPAIPNQKVRFLYQDYLGQMRVLGCDGVTQGDAGVATCTITGQDAEDFFAGTGLWQATYAGGTRLEGSEFTGVVPGGATSFETAAKNYQELLKGVIEIEVVKTPPGCHRVDGSSPNASLLTISLSALDCSQLRALQITTNVVLAVTAVVVVVNAPAGVITEALKQGLYKAAEEIAKQAPIVIGAGL